MNDEAAFERGKRAGEREQREREVSEWRDKTEKRLTELEGHVAKVSKDFTEFVAIQRAVAANAVSNRTFLLGVAAVIASIITTILASH